MAFQKAFRPKLFCLWLIPLAALLLASCATLAFRPSQAKVEKLLALVDSGKVKGFKGLGEAPFIFDGEILLLQADVAALWDNLGRANLGLQKAQTVSIVRTDGDTWRIFSPAMEVRTFFGKYLDKATYLVTLEAPEGRYYLILGKVVQGYPRIQGFKGPVR